MLDKDILNQLYRYALSLAKNEDQAYDLLQSCIEKYLRADTNNIDMPVAYLKRTIRNAFIDSRRRGRFQVSLTQEIIETGDTEQTLAEPTLEDIYIQQREVNGIIDKLKPEESELLYLWAVEEYTVDEIAKLRNQSRGTLLSKMHRLKKRLRSELAEQAPLLKAN